MSRITAPVFILALFVRSSYACSCQGVPALDDAAHCTSYLVSGPQTLPAASITASSVYPLPRCQPGTTSRLNAEGGWCALHANADQWIQYDFGTSKTITGVITQGSKSTAIFELVTSFRIQYSPDGTTFFYYDNGKIFTGNWDRNTPVGNTFDPPICARYLRIRPVTWTNWVDLRAEVMGC